MKTPAFNPRFTRKSRYGICTVTDTEKNITYHLNRRESFALQLAESYTGYEAERKFSEKYIKDSDTADESRKRALYDEYREYESNFIRSGILVRP